MSERTGLVTFQGNGLTLAGNPVAVGDAAPDFTVLTNGLAPAKLADFTEKGLILIAVPSLDTAVCDLEARRFNNEMEGLAGKAKALVVSMDLPFAQKRWADAAGVTNIVTLSDHRDTSFGLAYGLLIKELRLLARTVLVLGPDRKVAYMELVPEVTNEPDYAAALAALGKVL
ncbi:Redoxin domain protein [Solidesulfovibrio carbinoliphilus subsp. oakridgensis]|uniref:Redoxin domain protein n=1 Tax=Solidesulfovibrio carbinoliphilus subsp. oakridgensis TaxID=694327 RepID=G7Q9A2_9BACT|nr:thiol peroxidase [Solidesulfovibrio carbinoliphilus]EHJ48145.1 Redoxin domain protein [Solidesulfovibrio carbinoliphilus subsp. oakridgensis]